MRRRAVCHVCRQEREVTYAPQIGRQLCDDCLGDLIAYCASFGRPDDEEPWVRPLKWLELVTRSRADAGGLSPQTASAGNGRATPG